MSRWFVINSFNPYVRYAELVTIPYNYTKLLLAYDFRLLYVAEGSFTVETENTSFSAFEGDLVTIPPATAYRLRFSSEIPVYYILNFDFMGNSVIVKPRTPVSADKFETNEVFSTDTFPPFDKIFLLRNFNMAESILKEIHSYSKENTVNAKHMQSALLKYILTKASMLKEEEAKLSGASKLISEIKSFINQNHSIDITNNLIAKHFGYHPYHLSALFLTSEKITLHKYIDKVRLECARNMLVQTNKQIGDIAYECGFKDSSYFCKFFKKYMSVSPVQYRNLIK